MEITIWHMTPYSFGGSSLYAPFSTRLELELNPDGYGKAIQEITVVMALPETKGKLTKKEKAKFGVRPRKRFTRKSGKVSVEYLSEFSTAYDEESPGLKEINAATQDVLNAMMLVVSTVKPTDDFDVEAFEDSCECLSGFAAWAPKCDLRQLHRFDGCILVQAVSRLAFSKLKSHNP